MTPNPSNPAKQEFTDILQSVSFETTQETLKKETGQKIAKRIYSAQSVEGDLNFFKARADRWNELARWAMGKQSNKEFLSFLNVSDANKSYLNIDMSPIMVGSQFVITLVESMTKNEEYPCVTAVDDGSMTEKEQRKLDALFRMNNAQQINQMEEAAGMMFEPPNAYVPENELAAEVHFKLEDRLPKEVEYEQRLESALVRNQYQRVLKPRLYFDYIVCAFGATKIESDGKGGYNIRKCVPQNMIYNYFLSDTGKHELGYIGEVYALKVKDIRTKYGKSETRKDGLSEEDIFKLAKASGEKNGGTSFIFTWQAEYENYNYDRPWDEFSIPVYDFEIQLEISDHFVSKVDNFGKENIKPRNSKPNPQSEKVKPISKVKKRWIRGVYAFHSDMMLYWGLPDIVLFPFLDIEEGLSSYSINIPLNQGEYVPSLFERALEPLKEYALTKLKRKQLISKLRPSGIRIDIESARNIDLGNGQSIPWEEILRIHDHTGNEIYSSRGVNPNEREGPAISAMPHDDTVQKIIQLTEVLASCIAEVRSLLGVPMYRDGSDVGDRTSGVLQDQQLTSSFNVTDHIPNALNQLMEETLYKCCLLEWQKAVREDNEEIMNTQFQVSVMMKPTEYQKKVLQERINIALQTVDKYGNPQITLKDAFYIENIKDFKLAQLYLAHTIETNRKKHMEEAAALDKQNQENQIASSQAASQGKLQEEQQKTQAAIMLDEAKAKNEMNKILLQGIFDLAKVGAPIPHQFSTLVDMVMENVAIPLAVENRQMAKEVQQQQQAERQEAAQMQQVEQIAAENGVAPEEVMQQMAAQEQQVA
jgi:energy-coupling factor transporter ATP-binding protein EcfA2